MIYLDDIDFSYVPKRRKADKGAKLKTKDLNKIIPLQQDIVQNHVPNIAEPIQIPSYQLFVNRLANKGINVNDGVYDYKSFYNANPNLAMRIANGDNSVHFPDTYKTPLHPTFSTESMYSNDETKGGTWYKTNVGWIFNHSPFTAKHLDDTDDYLGENARNGVVEMSRLGDIFRLPTITVKGKRLVKIK